MYAQSKYIHKSCVRIGLFVVYPELYELPALSIERRASSLENGLTPLTKNV
jgi:hypothetical protein